MNAIQLDLFYEQETTPIEKEMKYVKEIAMLTKSTAEKVRRNLFAKQSQLVENQNELKCLFQELDMRLAIIERNICAK